MENLQELYFERDTDWYDWLLKNHNISKGVHLILYKLETNIPTMRWEEAVKVALCFGWIDSTVKSLGNGKRRQYFSPRNPKSTWSALNKRHIKDLESRGLIQEPGYKMIALAKKSGTWSELDYIEELILPKDLETALSENKNALKNFKNFPKGYCKHYLFWLHQAKRDQTRQKRILEIVRLCEANIKTRGW